ncbi:hypothetical protein ARMA_0677 [Ardenticatena maritima]|uniref:Acid phosphatase n=1 Tax=Ardenticatena maritima TaxID=872965 RepID=A0A0M9UBV4_9CHLR|nr:hypothetical protein ARMA_0677 [Ardenticatena maritima]
MQNDVLLAALFGWLMAQILKVFTHRAIAGRWDLGVAWSTGGMPSTHSAIVAGLATSVALQHGLADTRFAITVVFAGIVMYDAAGIRRAAGLHARILNQILAELFEGHPLSQAQLRELLGHTPLQVLVGAIVGIASAWVYWLWLR